MSGDFSFALEVLATGALIAFIALGYSLVYGILRFVNFAHGEIVAVSAFGALFFTKLWGIDSLLIACLVGGIFGAVVAFLLELIVYRPLRGRGAMTLLLASFGASITIQAVMGILWSSRSRPIALEDPTIGILGLSIQAHHMLLLFLAIVTAFVIEFGLRRTVWGLVIRGYPNNPDQISVLGIRVNEAVSKTFVATGFLAGVAGVCLGLQSGVDPKMGGQVGLWAFAATVMGGLGSVRGALAGGMLMGGVLALSTRYLSVVYVDGIAFLVMTFVLLIRPNGLFTFMDRKV